MNTNQNIDALVEKQYEIINSIIEEMNKVLVGQKKLIQRLLVAMICKGHILIESVPGLAKTTAITTLARSLYLTIQRIQFTPDLLPSDLIGNRIFNPQNHEFYVKKGPIFANFVIADEINRSPAKVQSALLEAMQEKKVTIGEESFQLPDPFFVMATQNPIEQEGTYPLPEAQIDRFMLKFILDYPTEDEELEIMSRSEIINPEKIKCVATRDDIIKFQDTIKKIYVEDSIKKYIKDIIFATRNTEKENSIKNIQGMISLGASPRGSINLLLASKAIAFLAGRNFVLPEDVKEIAPDILRHRVVMTYEAESEGITSDYIISEILSNVEIP